MNNEQQLADKISAYLDGALSADEVASLMAEYDGSIDKVFAEAARYQIIGDALRGELSDASMIDVSAQVREAVRNESFEVVKPAVAGQRSDTGFNLVSWLDSMFGSLARPVAGMAVAASVAVLMVVTVVQPDSPAGMQPLAGQASVQPAKVAAPVLAKQTLANSKPAVTETHTPEFDRYLVEHAEFAAQDTIQGRIPYVRAVSYEAE